MANPTMSTNAVTMSTISFVMTGGGGGSTARPRRGRGTPHSGLRGQNGQCASLPLRALDDAAAEYAIAVVEHDGLARRDRRDRLIERQLHFGAVDAQQLGLGSGSAVPYLQRQPRSDGGGGREPIDLASHEAASQELRSRPDHHRAVVRTDGDDEHRLAETTRHAATL